MLVLDADDASASAFAALESDCEDVFPVEREHVTNGKPSVRRKRHVLAHAGILLLETERVHLLDRSIIGASNRCATDLRCRRAVARHQRRGDREHIGVVVEPEPGHVAR